MPEEDVDEGFAIEDLLALMGLDRGRAELPGPARRRRRSRTPASLWLMAVVESLAQSILYARAVPGLPSW